MCGIIGYTGRRPAGPIVIDARLKPGFPEELSCDDDTAKLVNRRWAEYFPAGRVVMGDSEKSSLD